MQFPIGLRHSFLICSAVIAQQSIAQVSSTFDSDEDGWTVTDSAGGAASAPVWIGGEIRTADLYDWNTFSAPAKFTGIFQDILVER